MCHVGVVTWCLSANHSSPHNGPILSDKASITPDEIKNKNEGNFDSSKIRFSLVTRVMNNISLQPWVGVNEPLRLHRGLRLQYLKSTPVVLRGEGGGSRGVRITIGMTLYHKLIMITRMHSSRMRTVRCSGHLLRGGVSAWGVVCPRGVSA